MHDRLLQISELYFCMTHIIDSDDFALTESTLVHVNQRETADFPLMQSVSTQSIFKRNTHLLLRLGFVKPVYINPQVHMIPRIKKTDYAFQCSKHSNCILRVLFRRDISLKRSQNVSSMFASLIDFCIDLAGQLHDEPVIT